VIFGLKSVARSAPSVTDRQGTANAYNGFVLEALANLTAVAHLAYFFGVVVGFIVIVAGPVHGIQRNLWFRLGHMIAIAIVVVEDAGAFRCPLNNLEWGLRSSASGTREASVGLGGVLDRLLFHAISGRVLNDLWWVFAVLAVLLMFVRPCVKQSVTLAPRRTS
jgi:hypothetical protein